MTSQPSPTDGEKLRAYYDIEPLTDFDWARTEPLQLRPYKPKFHLTMGTFPLPWLSASLIITP